MYGSLLTDYAADAVPHALFQFVPIESNASIVNAAPTILSQLSRCELLSEAIASVLAARLSAENVELLRRTFLQFLDDSRRGVQAGVTFKGLLFAMGTHEKELALHQLGSSELAVLPPQWSPTTISISKVVGTLDDALNIGTGASDEVDDGVRPEGAILVWAAYCRGQWMAGCTQSRPMEIE